MPCAPGATRNVKSYSMLLPALEGPRDADGRQQGSGTSGDRSVHTRGWPCESCRVCDRPRGIMLSIQGGSAGILPHVLSASDRRGLDNRAHSGLGRGLSMSLKLIQCRRNRAPRGGRPRGDVHDRCNGSDEDPEVPPPIRYLGREG